jgi:hypothetical protein
MLQMTAHYPESSLNITKLKAVGSNRKIKKTRGEARVSKEI